MCDVQDGLSLMKVYPRRRSPPFIGRHITNEYSVHTCTVDWLVGSNYRQRALRTYLAAAVNC